MAVGVMDVEMVNPWSTNDHGTVIQQTTSTTKIIVTSEPMELMMIPQNKIEHLLAKMLVSWLWNVAQPYQPQGII